MKTHLYILVRLPGGKRQFCQPARSKNHKLREGWAIVNGEPEHHPGSVYYLRYLNKQKKRVWKGMGTNAAEAINAQLQMEAAAAAKKLGVKVEDPADQQTHNLQRAQETYLLDLAKGDTAESTITLYESILGRFVRGCTKSTLEAVTREDLIAFRDGCKDDDLANSTIEGYLSTIRTFLARHGIPWPLEASDHTTPTKKKVRAYSRAEVVRLLSVADVDEADFIHFFVGTGCRRGEVTHTTWADVDFEQCLILVREKEDWTPKDKEEGQIPVPMDLIERLRARRLRYPDTTLIFPVAAKNHGKFLLALVRRLAYKAHLNCGECHFPATEAYPKGRHCATGPHCARFRIHTFRKTFASWHSRAGVPVHDIMRWLRHSKLDTTLGYIADGDDTSKETRDRVENTFSGLILVPPKQQAA